MAILSTPNPTPAQGPLYKNHMRLNLLGIRNRTTSIIAVIDKIARDVCHLFDMAMELRIAIMATKDDFAHKEAIAELQTTVLEAREERQKKAVASQAHYLRALKRYVKVSPQRAFHAREERCHS